MENGEITAVTDDGEVYSTLPEWYRTLLEAACTEEADAEC